MLIILITNGSESNGALINTGFKIFRTRPQDSEEIVETKRIIFDINGGSVWVPITLIRADENKNFDDFDP